MFACCNVYKLLQAQLCFKNNSTTSTPYINTFSDIYLRYLIINKRVFNLNIQYIIQNILIWADGAICRLNKVVKHGFTKT